MSLLVVLVLVLGTAAASADESTLDYEVENGHFYRQAAGAAANSGRGFLISDDDGVPFWSEFQRLGGVDTLGYPISRRFELDGYLCQATQRAILQWHPDRGEVELINVMEYLSRLGKDDLLKSSRLVPRPVPASADERAGWLTADGTIATVYAGAIDPLALFGLPLSPPQAMGPATAMRLQRGVIYVWNEPHAWAGPGQVTVANAGDFVREANGLPPAALEADAPPPVRTRLVSSRGGVREGSRIAGVATYYGYDFEGLPMANGQPYRTADPTTVASNSHPLGTRLRITRTSTGASIDVTVTDRGAFRMPIVVDMSMAAFQQLGALSEGVIGIVVDRID